MADVKIRFTAEDNASQQAERVGDRLEKVQEETDQRSERLHREETRRQEEAARSERDRDAARRRGTDSDINSIRAREEAEAQYYRTQEQRATAYFRTQETLQTADDRRQTRRFEDYEARNRARTASDDNYYKEQERRASAFFRDQDSRQKADDQRHIRRFESGLQRQKDLDAAHGRRIEADIRRNRDREKSDAQYYRAQEQRLRDYERNHARTQREIERQVRDLQESYLTLFFALGTIGQEIERVADALLRFTRGNIEASAAMETFRASVSIVVGDAELAAERIDDLLRISDELVGLDTGSIINWSNQLQAVGASAEVTNTLITSVTRATAELGKGSFEANRVLRQLTQAYTGNKIVLQDFRPIIEEIPQFFGAATEAMNQQISSIDDLRNASEKLGITYRDTIVRVFESLNNRVQGANLDTIAAQVDILGDRLFRLRAILGDQLRPAVISILRLGNSLLETLLRLPQPIQALIAGGTVLAGVLGKTLVSAINTAIFALAGLQLTNAVQQIQALRVAVAGTQTTMVAGAAGLSAFGGVTSRVTNAVSNLRGVFTRLLPLFRANAGVFSGLAAAGAFFVTQSVRMVGAINETRQATENARRETEAWTETLQGVNSAASASNVFRDQITQLNEYRESLREARLEEIGFFEVLTGHADGIHDRYARLIEQTDENARRLQALQGSLGNTPTQRRENQAAEAARLTAELEKLNTALADVQQRQTAVNNHRLRLLDQIPGSERQIERQIEAQRAPLEAEELEIISQLENVEALLAAYQKLATGAVDASGEMRNLDKELVTIGATIRRTETALRDAETPEIARSTANRLEKLLAEERAIQTAKARTIEDEQQRETELERIRQEEIDATTRVKQDLQQRLNTIEKDITRTQKAELDERSSAYDAYLLQLEGQIRQAQQALREATTTTEAESLAETLRGLQQDEGLTRQRQAELITDPTERQTALERARQDRLADETDTARELQRRLAQIERENTETLEQELQKRSDALDAYLVRLEATIRRTQQALRDATTTAEVESISETLQNLRTRQRDVQAEQAELVTDPTERETARERVRQDRLTDDTNIARETQRRLTAIEKETTRQYEQELQKRSAAYETYLTNLETLIQRTQQALREDASIETAQTLERLRQRETEARTQQAELITDPQERQQALQSIQRTQQEALREDTQIGTQAFDDRDDAVFQRLGEQNRQALADAAEARNAYNQIVRSQNREREQEITQNLNREFRHYRRFYNRLSTLAVDAAFGRVESFKDVALGFLEQSARILLQSEIETRIRIAQEKRIQAEKRRTNGIGIGESQDLLGGGLSLASLLTTGNPLGGALQGLRFILQIGENEGREIGYLLDGLKSEARF